MAFCVECGAKLPSGAGFCPKCGAATGGKAAQAAQARQPKPEGEAVAAKAAQPSAFWKAVGIIFGVIFGAFLIYAISGSTGSDFGFGSTTVDCAKQAKPGAVTCGHCASGTHAGQCRYCPSGTTCSGEICGTLTCKSGSGPGPNVTVTPEPDVSVTPGPTGGGGGYLGDPPIDSKTGCPPQGYSGPRGSVDLECSQWVEAGRCSFQSCACHYATSRGDAANAYYRTSDGAYYRCAGSGQTLSCNAAAAAVVQHCGPASDNVNIVWGS